VKHRIDLRAATNEDRTDALGRTDLVPGDREQIDRHVPDGEVDLAERLHGVRVHDASVCLHTLGDFRNGLDGANLVVDPHDRADRNRVIDGTVE
jgi:hypothetical protein